jgi:hypothetical protein
MLDITVTPEVADAIAEIGRVDPRYHSPEGVLFRKALALIEKYWVPEQAFGPEKFCSVGAIDFADGGKLTSEAQTAIFDQFDRFICCGNAVSIGNWNDSSTHAQVISKWNEIGHANGWL